MRQKEDGLPTGAVMAWPNGERAPPAKMPRFFLFLDILLLLRPRLCLGRNHGRTSAGPVNMALLVNHRMHLDVTFLLQIDL
jgi:hypothetical protein